MRQHFEMEKRNPPTSTPRNPHIPSPTCPKNWCNDLLAVADLGGFTLVSLFHYCFVMCEIDHQITPKKQLIILAPVSSKTDSTTSSYELVKFCIWKMRFVALIILVLDGAINKNPHGILIMFLYVFNVSFGIW